MGIELVQAGLKVRALERGEDRLNIDYAYPKPADELAFTKRHKIMQSPHDAAFTIRHTAADTALPMRELGAFRLGDGVGGAGLHWTGMITRPTPLDLKMKTYAEEHFKRGALDEELRIEDFPVDWADIEPHMDFLIKYVDLQAKRAIFAVLFSPVVTRLKARVLTRSLINHLRTV